MRKVLKGLDALLEYLGIAFLGAIVLIVTWAVVARTFFDAEPDWSAQLSVGLMIWAVALGTAIGFRERSHTTVDVVVDKFSARAQQWVARFTHVLIFAFGVFLILRGVQLLLNADQGALYAVMPLSGFMICVYTTLQFMGVRTERSGDEDEESSNKNLDE